MLSVYRPYFESGYDWVTPVGGAGSVPNLKYRNRGDPWEPLWMFMTTADAEGMPRRPADMPWHSSGTMVLKEKARVLEPVLGKDVELLSAYDAEGEPLWLVHAWRMVDALDESASEVHRFRGSGRIMDVRRWSLRAAAVRDLTCFRVPQQPSKMLVTEKVVAAVNSAGLHGTVFRPIWHSCHSIMGQGA